MNDQKRVSLSLDLSMPEERAFFEAYKSLPRQRAQEFLRRCAMIGFLSRKRLVSGFYESPSDPRLKSNADSDIIAVDTRVAPHELQIRNIERILSVTRAVENAPSQTLHDEESLRALAERHAFEGDPQQAFQDDGENASQVEAVNQAAPSSGARMVGWKKPKTARSAVKTEDKIDKKGESSTSEAARVNAIEHDDNADPRTWLEKRIFQSLDAKEGSSHAGQDDSRNPGEERATGGGQSGAGGSRTGGGQSAAGSANILKGFFGEE